MIFDYYKAALSRSWIAVWDWATGQGIVLTWALAASALFCAMLVTFFRAFRKHHSWSDALTDVRSAVRDFILSAVGATLFLFFVLFAIFFVKDAPEQASLAQRQVTSLKTQIDVQSAKGLFVECHVGSLPIVMPASGRYYIVWIFGDGRSTNVISLAEIFGPPGSALTWPMNAAIRAAQCVITNYSDDVLVNVRLRPKLNFYKMTKNADGASQGRGIDRSEESYVNISKMDAGADKPFVFYFLNNTPIFVDVEMPKTAEVQRLGGSDRPVVVASPPMRIPLSVLDEKAQ
jgi:hypothetical protein